MIGTARAEKHAFLAAVGVDEAVDYTTGPVAGRIHDVDVVLDLVGGEAAADALSTLRDGGTFVTVTGAADELRGQAAGRVRLEGILVEPDRLGMEALAELVAEGALRPHVSATFPLADAARAHEASETGRTQGQARPDRRLTERRSAAGGVALHPARVRGAAQQAVRRARDRAQPPERPGLGHDDVVAARPQRARRRRRHARLDLDPPRLGLRAG